MEGDKMSGPVLTDWGAALNSFRDVTGAAHIAQVLHEQSVCGLLTNEWKEQIARELLALAHAYRKANTRAAHLWTEGARDRLYREVTGMRTSAEAENYPKAMLFNALDTLDDKDRNAIAGRIRDGLTFSELASRVGVSTNTANRTYHIAMKRLRNPRRWRWIDEEEEANDLIARTIDLISDH